MWTYEEILYSFQSLGDHLYSNHLTNLAETIGVVPTVVSAAVITRCMLFGLQLRTEQRNSKELMKVYNDMKNNPIVMPNFKEFEDSYQAWIQKTYPYDDNDMSSAFLQFSESEISKLVENHRLRVQSVPIKYKNMVAPPLSAKFLKSLDFLYNDDRELVFYFTQSTDGLKKRSFFTLKNGSPTKLDPGSAELKFLDTILSYKFIESLTSEEYSRMRIKQFSHFDKLRKIESITADKDTHNLNVENKLKNPLQTAKVLATVVQNIFIGFGIAAPTVGSLWVLSSKGVFPCEYSGSVSLLGLAGLTFAASNAQPFLSQMYRASTGMHINGTIPKDVEGELTRLHSRVFQQTTGSIFKLKAYFAKSSPKLKEKAIMNLKNANQYLVNLPAQSFLLQKQFKLQNRIKLVIFGYMYWLMFKFGLPYSIVLYMTSLHCTSALLQLSLNHPISRKMLGISTPFDMRSLPQQLTAFKAHFRNSFPSYFTGPAIVPWYHYSRPYYNKTYDVYLNQLKNIGKDFAILVLILLML